MDGIVESGTATILGSIGRVSLDVRSVLVDPIVVAFCRNLEIREEVVGAHKWYLPWEEDPIFVVISAGVRLFIAIAEAAVVEIGLDARSWRRL